LQENAGIDSSGRSSPGSGGRRWCSAGIHEGEWANGGWRRRSGCGERWGGSGAREEGSERSGDRRMSGATRAWGCHAARGCHGAWPRPADDARQWPERGAHGRRAPHERADRTERGREASDGWAAAQCRAVVPLTSGADLSAGAGRARAWVGRPKKKRRRAARMHGKILHLFKLV
jgi:hypothetical protein